MDSGSVISLSSTSSKGSGHTSSAELASVLTVSSEVQRVPVSWGSGKVAPQKKVLDIGGTLTQAEKVTNWMQSCNYDDHKCDSPEIDNENNKSTCIRYDFDKKPTVTALPKSCFTRATPLFSYMEEAKKSVSLNNGDTHRANGSRVRRNSENTPLSPESQKKELCNYLQLMKPDDQQSTFFIEYRRSGRVRVQQNESKMAKRKDKQETSVEEIDVDRPTISSEQELRISRIMKMKNILKRKLNFQEKVNLLPLPPKKIYADVVDFEDCIKDIVEEELKNRSVVEEELGKKPINGYVRKVKKRRKFKFPPKLRPSFRKGFFNNKPFNLRSKVRLTHVSLDSLILRKSQLRKKARKKILKEMKEKKSLEKASLEKAETAGCEIISVHTNSDDENVDLKNFVDDMLELDKMSEEHRKSVIESRILASSSITNLINKRMTHEADVQRAYKIFSDLSNERKLSEEKENNTQPLQECVDVNINQTENNNTKSLNQNEKNSDNLVMDLIISEHDYTTFRPAEDENSDCLDDSNDQSVRNLSPVPIPDLEVLPVSKEVETKSLHRSLTITNRRKFHTNYGLHNWNSNCSRKLNHAITISKKNGSVLRAFYQDYNLIIVQQNLISFWTQSALGNVLGAQNMWIPKGEIQRITLNSTYTQKNAAEMVITTETSVAFVELWTKEHKSDVRQVPLADVFATVYFWRLRQTGLEKKALQLENIQGFADDVQYCVLKWYSKIIVSWHSVQGNEKKTKIHSYHLAADFQTVANISEIQPVEHYVSSLHNIEDCDSLVMGCGENKVTLWNVEYGYIVATIEMSNIKSPLSTLWVNCDRGFLFTIQECVDQELRLIAINGMNHSWKKLQNYNPISGFSCLKGVCMENGILVAYYSEGILCWNAQTGELIVEEVPNECEYIPSGKHVIMIVNDNIIVRHSLSHLITDL
ncbi:hypothetical protein Zmor_023230 [Zophobas morio]|uniref:Uncharacterized protein n=1 Tax=Zophobas morio TaxID=2755281 RepID=A0AA38HZ07_9CUCU|nr:hypothetical protein Zmor_023230 [Zophobas morio]